MLGCELELTIVQAPAVPETCAVDQPVDSKPSLNRVVGPLLEVTVRVTVAVWVLVPPVPVTVTEYVPTGVVDATVRVRVEVPDPGAAIEAGLNAEVTPV